MTENGGDGQRSWLGEVLLVQTDNNEPKGEENANVQENYSDGTPLSANVRNFLRVLFPSPATIVSADTGVRLRKLNFRNNLR